MYMDFHAVRVRAGLLNTIVWFAIFNVWLFKTPMFLKVIYPIVAIEFFISANMGYTFSPLGAPSIVIAWIFHDKPWWKPSRYVLLFSFVRVSSSTFLLLLYFLFCIPWHTERLTYTCFYPSLTLSFYLIITINTVPCVLHGMLVFFWLLASLLFFFVVNSLLMIQPTVLQLR